MTTRSPDGDSPRLLRVHGRVARDIGIAIVTGQHRPGDLLEGEVAASEALGVSRTAYREAVRILVAKGLVQSRPKIGTRVSPVAEWHLLDPDVLGWIFAHEPDPALLAALFELRRIVEPEAAALAASRRHERHLAAMHDALARMEALTLRSEAGQQADQEFHAALLDAAGNAFLASLTSGVGAAVAWTTAFKQRKGGLTRDAVPDHRHVLEAVDAGDADAAHRAMAALIDMAFLDTTDLPESSSHPIGH
jgi:DNA-binding FadR family transcriptional regulator